MASRITFTPLFPELFPIVASYLPLYATPLTLLSLALTNHRMYEVIHDLLYSCLILRNEKDVLSIFQRILANAELGRTVRELHVMSEISVAALNGETAFDVVTGLIRLVKVGYLPYIHTLGLHLSREWRKDDMWNDTVEIGHLPSHFWEDLEDKCPRLRTLVLSGLSTGLWLHESGIYELKGMKKITQLGITFAQRVHKRYDGPERLLKSVCDLSSRLHTLNLAIYSGSNSGPVILSQNFPQLRSLTLAKFGVPRSSESMAFWRRHPLIEKLKLRDSHYAAHWFSETVESDFLPNLKYLEASFHDIRSLLPILPRLIGLSVQQSLNAQVPYLLRCLIPPGLPSLESLEIDQDWSRNFYHVDTYEGNTWYETPDGKFHTEERLNNAPRTFEDGYILSIVKGAPNPKELCLHGGIPLLPLTMETLAPQLAEFRQMERLYFGGPNDFRKTRRTQEHRAAFYTSSQAIAEICKSLERITDIFPSPYLAVKIRRNHDGEVEEVIPTEGYGMTIGSEDEAFPRNRPMWIRLTT